MLVSSYNSEKIMLQLDFSENASLLQQNEIQSANWNHNQVILFTGHTWFNSESNESFIISDDLSHTKDAVYTFVAYILQYLKQKYLDIKVVWSDGAASQFKQRYLFANLDPWQKQFAIENFGIFLLCHIEKVLWMVLVIQ